jgi:lipopolysaccharide/colanic/teichoic acid biosynthesis glycosyltransferase
MISIGAGYLVNEKEQGRTLPLWKRNLDVACILLTLPLTLPLAAVIALLIKLTSRGPVIFRQERIGQGGRRFVCFKFRTMKVNTDARAHREHVNGLINGDGPMTKLDLKGDERLIPCGAWLRATGLDELAQLINVWRGEMSLVGPRPCLPYEYAEYSEWAKGRLRTLPGLTGLWQVSGKNRTTFNEMIRLDLQYAEERSLGLDLQIMVRTLPALVWQVVEARLANRSIPVQVFQKAT